MGHKKPPVSGNNIAKDFNQEHRKFETGKLKKFTAKEKAEFFDAVKKRILQTEAGYSNAFVIVLNEAGRPIALRLGFPRGLESIKAMKNDSKNLKLFKFLNSTQTAEENYKPVRYRAGSETFKVKQFLTGFFFEDWPNMPLDILAGVEEFYYIDWEDIILPIELIDNFKYANERIKGIWRAEIRKAQIEYKNGSVQRDQIVHFIEPLEEDFNLTGLEVNRTIARLIPLLNVAAFQMNDESETEISSNENETDIEDSEENERGEIEKSTDETEENEMNKQLQNKSSVKLSNETEKTLGEVKKGDQICGKNKTTKRNKTKTKKPNRKNVETLKKSLESFSTTNKTFKSKNKRFLSNENETQSNKVVKRNDIKDVSNSKQNVFPKESETSTNGINENKSDTSQKANSKQQIQNQSKNQTQVNSNVISKKRSLESSIESETDHESISTVVNTKNTLKRSLESDSESIANEKANRKMKKTKINSRKVKSKSNKRTNKNNTKSEKEISKQTTNQTQSEKSQTKEILDQELQMQQLDSTLKSKTDHQMDIIETDDVASSKTEKSFKSVSVVIETDKSENKNFDFDKDESENSKITNKGNIENETNLKQTITENKDEINQNDEEKLENNICKISVESKDINKIIDENENPTQSCEDENLKMESQVSLKSIGEVNGESPKQMDDSFVSNLEISKLELEPETNQETAGNSDTETKSDGSENLNPENNSQGTASNESLEMQNQMAASSSQISTNEAKTESNPIPKPFKIPKLSKPKSNTVTNVLSGGQSSSTSTSSSSIEHNNVDQTAEETTNQTQPKPISEGSKAPIDIYFSTILTEPKVNAPKISVSTHKPAFGHNISSSAKSTTHSSRASKYHKSRGSHSKERDKTKETDSKHVSSGSSSKMTALGQISSEKSSRDTNPQIINDKKGKSKRNDIRNSVQYYSNCLFRTENPNPKTKEKVEFEIYKPKLTQIVKSSKTNNNNIKARSSLQPHSTTIPLSSTTSNDSSNSEVKLPKLGMMLKGKNDTKLANDEICSKTSCNKTKIATSITDSAISSSKTDETIEATNGQQLSVILNQSIISSAWSKAPETQSKSVHDELTNFSRECNRLLEEELKKHRSLALTMVHYECESNNKKRYYVLVEVHYIDLYKNHPVIVRTLCFESVPNFDLVTIRSMFDKFMKDPKFELRKKYLIVLADDVLSAAIPRKYQLHRDEIEALLCYLNPNEYKKWYHSTRDNSCQSFERQNPMLNVGKVLEGYRKPNSSMNIREYKFRNEYESQMKQYKKQIEILEQYPNLTIFNDSPTAFMHRNYPKLFEASIFFKSLRGSSHRIEIIKQRLIRHCPKAESMIKYGNLRRKLLSDWMFITLNREIEKLVDPKVYSTCYHLVKERKQHRSKLNNSNGSQ